MRVSTAKMCRLQPVICASSHRLAEEFLWREHFHIADLLVQNADALGLFAVDDLPWPDFDAVDQFIEDGRSQLFQIGVTEDDFGKMPRIVQLPLK